MRHYDPWVFGMLWEIEHREELGRLDKARQARQAAAWQAASSLGPSAPRYWTVFSQLIGSLSSITWLRLRRQPSQDVGYR